MYVRPTAPLSIGGVIDDAIKLYLTSFSRCWPIALVAALISVALSLTLTPQLPQSFANGREALEQMLAVERSPWFLGSSLLLLLVSLLFHGALLARQNAVARNDESFTFARALATGVRKLPSMVVAGVILLLIVTLGLVALIIPGLYLIGRLVLWMPALFVDDAGPLESVETTWKLTRGHWWRAAAIVTVAVIIVLVFSFVLSTVAGLIAGLSTAFGHGGLSGRLHALQLISAATNIITLPMAPALWLAMYNDFKLRREGGDLAARVGALPSA